MPASKLLMDIGDRLRERREEMGLTQKQAAKLLNISETFYGEMERGNKRLSIERILEVREKMDIDPTWLLTGKVVKPSLVTEMFRECPPEKKETLKNLLMELGKMNRNDVPVSSVKSSFWKG